MNNKGLLDKLGIKLIFNLCEYDMIKENWETKRKTFYIQDVSNKYDFVKLFESSKENDIKDLIERTSYNIWKGNK